MHYPYRVLVVEDHALQCIYLRDLLLDAGFAQVETAQDCRQALDLLAAQEFDLIVLDLEMPDMDGMQFIRLLASTHPQIRLAITSAWPVRILESASLLARNWKLDVQGIFPKPITAEHAAQLGASLHLAQQKRQAGGQHTAERSPARLPDMNRTALEQALQTRQIIGWYQPKQSLADGRITGAEALARWVHPEHGVISPADFLPAITESGLERALLLHILDQVLLDYQHWRQAGHHITLNVNLPSHLLDEAALPDLLLEKVQSRDVPPGDITFELLESSRTHDSGDLLLGSSRLRLKGFGLAQDDFGIGYSSMQALTSVPFTELKIDRSFVSGASHDANLAAAITASVQLGKRLGMSITAEGIETAADLALVRDAGCDYAQGYLIARPMPREAFSAFLAPQLAPS